MNSSSKNFILLGLAVIANVAAVSAYLYVFGGIKEKNEQISRLEDDIIVKQEQIVEDTSLKATLEQTEKDRNRIFSYFVHEEEVADFISTIERLGKSAGTAVEINSVADEKSADDLGSLTLSLLSRGTWQDTINFLAMLENLPYKVTVDDSTFDASRSEKGVVLWSMHATLKAITAKK
jgi:Tfp pilus assembly protein PilO